jgi:DNA-binding transcriptional ArsR family regulator
VCPSSPEEEFNAEKAELYEALGHPMRILILQALSEKPLGFSDLKRRTGIESSGNMTFHLTKLGSLVRVTAGGTYCLSDEGKEAIRVIEATERVTAGGVFVSSRPFLKSLSAGKRVLPLIWTILIIGLIGGLMVIQGYQMATQEVVSGGMEQGVPASVNLGPGQQLLLGGASPAWSGKVHVVYVLRYEPVSGSAGIVLEFRGVQEIPGLGEVNRTFFTGGSSYGDTMVSFPDNMTSVTYDVTNLSPENVTLSGLYLRMNPLTTPNRDAGITLLFTGALVLVLAFGLPVVLHVRSRTATRNSRSE